MAYELTDTEKAMNTFIVDFKINQTLKRLKIKQINYYHDGIDFIYYGKMFRIKISYK